MSDFERQAMLGRLAEKRQEAKKLELRADGLITAVRMLLNPYDSLKKLDVEKAFQLCSDLRDLKRAHTTCLADIEKLEEALGVG